MANPTLTLDATSFPTLGYVRSSWTNATKGANWYSWRLYRRVNTASAKWALVKEYLADIANYTWDDYFATSNISQQYVVVRVFLVAGVPTEEAIGGTVQAVTPASDNYWIVHPYNPSLTSLVYSVTGDSFSEEADVAEMNIIGRGRRADYGSTWGRRGSLNMQLRDKPAITARNQFLLYAAQQRSAPSYYWLRTPFGDMFRVVLSDLHADRMAGVGVNDYSNVSLSYAEVVT